MPRMVLKSNVRKLIREVEGRGLPEMIDEWKNMGQGTAQENVLKQESARGYDLHELYESISAEDRGQLSAAIVVSAWYAHFFEYGTRFIDPMPFLRPAKRKADKTFRDHAKRKLQAAADRASL